MSEIEYIEELRKVDAFTTVLVRVPKPAEQPEADKAEESTEAADETQAEQPEADKAVKRARKP